MSKTWWLAPISRLIAFSALTVLISVISGCGSGGSSANLEQRPPCNLVSCTKRQIEYVWDHERGSYQPRDVGCKAYNIDSKCLYGPNQRKSRAAGKSAAKGAVVFTEVSCVRKLVKNTSYTVPEAQLLCKNSIQKIEKKSDAWIRKDACIDKWIRAGQTVPQAIQNCYWGP